MTEAIHRSRVIASLLDHGVVGIGIGKLPVVDPVHSHTTDPNSPFFTYDRDRAFEVLGICEHRDIHRPECTGAPPDTYDSGILDLDVSGKRSRVCLNALHRADE